MQDLMAEATKSQAFSCQVSFADILAQAASAQGLGLPLKPNHSTVEQSAPDDASQACLCFVAGDG